MAKNSKNFRNLAIAGAFMSAFIAANDVGAQTAQPSIQFEDGKCYTNKDAVFNELERQGQFPLITAFRSIPSQPKQYLTTDNRLSSGFYLQESATELCFVTKYRSIRLNNTSNAIPEFATIAPANSEFNQFLISERDRVDAKVIFAAVALTKDANGVEKPTSKIVVLEGRDGACGTIAGYQCVSNRGTIIAGFANGSAAKMANLEEIKKDSNYTALVAYQQNPNVLLASNQQPK